MLVSFSSGRVVSLKPQRAENSLHPFGRFHKNLILQISQDKGAEKLKISEETPALIFLPYTQMLVCCLFYTSLMKQDTEEYVDFLTQGATPCNKQLSLRGLWMWRTDKQMSLETHLQRKRRIVIVLQIKRAG